MSEQKTTGKKRGKEKVYASNVDAAVAEGAKIRNIVLSKKNDKNGVTYNQPTREIEFTSVDEILAYLDGNEQHLVKLFGDRVANPTIQANDKRLLAIAAEGPERVIQDAVDSLIETKVFDDETEAREFVVAKLKAKGNIPENYGNIEADAEPVEA